MAGSSAIARSHSSFSVPPRDEAGEKNLAELRDRGIAPVANALNQSAGHVRSFFHMLRTELAFYVGGVNLHETLTGNTAPVVLPVPAASGERRFAVAALSDVCLCLNLGRRIVGNDIDGDGRDLVVITGANQGGKSTFLRSAGQAQLMMQCGLFVSATAFRADICDGLFTHYRREEDASMQSGKLDEELVRMSAIVDCLRRDSLVLFNESFASTNEREGSEIAGQIVRALLERQVKVFCVTHMFQLAQSFLDRDDTLFLRAERQEGGERSFKLIEGKPLTTSFGKDLYNRIFAVDPGQAGGGGAAARPDVAADRS